jgi:hypothetical protein
MLIHKKQVTSLPDVYFVHYGLREPFREGFPILAQGYKPPPHIPLSSYFLN